MPLSQDLEQYFTSRPFDTSAYYVVGPHLEDSPVLFLLLSEPPSAQKLHVKRETMASELIQQLSHDIGVTDIFTEDIHLALLHLETGTADADQHLQDGDINGVQHAQLVSPTPLTVMSIDEKQDYRSYGNMLQRWRASKERTQGALALVNGPVKRTTALASKTIQSILIRGDSYRAGRLPWHEYIRHLVQHVEACGGSLYNWPTLLELHELALKKQAFDVDLAKQEIELFGDKLIQALAQKEVWLRQTINAMSSAQIGEMYELESQIVFLRDYLEKSFTLRQLRESLFFRIAMYGAHAEGFEELEKPREMVSRARREKTFISGVLQGPTQILMLLTKKLLAADTYRNNDVPEVYDFILDVGIFTGFDDTDMPNLIQSVQYGNQYKAMMTPHVIKELETIEGQILEQVAISEQDREVVRQHTLFSTLRKRVLLQLDWGNRAWGYAREQQTDNLALQMKQSPLLQSALKTPEALAALDVLGEAESLARQYYQRLETRGQKMSAKLRAALAVHGLDRAIVYIEEQSCKALLTSLRRVHPKLSYVILVPIDEEEQRHLTDFSLFDFRQHDSVAPEERPVVYKNYEDDLGVLFRQQCENPLCRFSAPAIYNRVVYVTSPGSQAVFYCPTCDKFYCGLDLKAVELSEQVLEQEFSLVPFEFPELSQASSMFTLRCRHCGHFVGNPGNTVIWNIPQ